MIRIQVEAHVGAITNLEAVKQAGYEVAIQSRKARPGYPIILVGERIYTAPQTRRTRIETAPSASKRRT